MPTPVNKSMIPKMTKAIETPTINPALSWKKFVMVSFIAPGFISSAVANTAPPATSNPSDKGEKTPQANNTKAITTRAIPTPTINAELSSKNFFILVVTPPSLSFSSVAFNNDFPAIIKPIPRGIWPKKISITPIATSPSETASIMTLSLSLKLAVSYSSLFTSLYPQ